MCWLEGWRGSGYWKSALTGAGVDDHIDGKRRIVGVALVKVNHIAHLLVGPKWRE